MIAVLGGGLAGLELGRRLRRRGLECAVLEARPRPGGLCRTERRGAWSWDIGPHAFYSKDPSLMRVYQDLPLDYIPHARKVRVCHRGPGGSVHEVAYPFENGLADLPWRHRLDCVWGYLRAPGRRDGGFSDLSDWIDRGLGAGIARHFMRPYNEKIWSCPLERVSMGLVKGKIEPEPAWKVVRNALVPGTVGRAYQANFLYPKGGAGAITDAVAGELGTSLRLGWELAAVEGGEGGWSLRSASGETLRARRVVSTIPLPRLLAALGGGYAAEYGGAFAHNDTYIVAVGLKEGVRPRRFADAHWVFFAGEELFYRVTVSSALEPSRPTTLVAEVTRKPGTEGLGEAGILSRVLAGLRGAGLVADESDVAFAECALEPFTYPIPTVGMEPVRARLEGVLRARDLHLLGRSGRWDYVNTDGIFAAVAAFMSGPAAAWDA